jgi:hypothetical protein
MKDHIKGLSKQPCLRIGWILSAVYYHPFEHTADGISSICSTIWPQSYMQIELILFAVCSKVHNVLWPGYWATLVH